MGSWMGPAEVKETHEAMGSWTGSAEVKKTWEMKEEFLVRALGSKTYPHKPQVFPGAHEPRMTAGLSEPQTADLTDDQLVDLTAHWFWIEAEHSPDTGGHLPSSSVQWCLGGPRGDDNWPDPEQGIYRGVVQPHPLSEPAELPCVLHQREISAGRVENCAAVSIAKRRNWEKQTFQNLKNGTIKRRKGALLTILFRSRFLSQDLFVEIVARRRTRQKESLMNFNTKSIKQTSN